MVFLAWLILMSFMWVNSWMGFSMLSILFVALGLVQVGLKKGSGLLLLLVLETFMLSVTFLWGVSVHSGGVSFSGLVTFFLVSVSEACVGLAVLVGASREKSDVMNQSSL